MLKFLVSLFSKFNPINLKIDFYFYLLANLYDDKAKIDSLDKIYFSFNFKDKSK